MPKNCRALIVAMALGPGLLCGCRRTGPVSEANLPTVRVVTAALVTGYEGTQYSISLMPNRQADLAFKSSGIVEQIRTVRGADGHSREITMGDTVHAGEMLARVRTVDYQQKVDQAEAALRNARAQRESAQASLTLAESNFTRASHLYEEQSLTRQDFDRARQQRDSAQAAVQQAEAGIADAQAGIDEARLALNDTAVLAPFPGVVVARHIELGNLAGASVAAFTVADLSRLKADFSVPDTALSEVPPGRQFAVRLAQDGRELTARVTAVSPSADPQSRVFTVELTLENQRGDLRPGVIGSVELAPKLHSQPYIGIPISCLVQSSADHGFAVFVLYAGPAARVRLRPVTIGATNGNKVQILSGIAVGERVVSAGAQTLHDNGAVRVLE